MDQVKERKTQLYIGIHPNGFINGTKLDAIEIINFCNNHLICYGNRGAIHINFS